MKKTIILIAATIAMTLTSNSNLLAQDNNFGFSKDDDGELFLTGTLEYECSKNTALDRLVAYMESLYGKDKVCVDADNRKICVDDAEETTKYVYNPFAGEFKDNVKYDLVITWSDDDSKEFQYTYSKLTLHSTAKGFANYDKNEPLRVVLKQYNKTQKMQNDPSLDKKARKEAMNSEADLRTSIEKIYSTLLADMAKTQECIE